MKKIVILSVISVLVGYTAFIGAQEIAGNIAINKAPVDGIINGTLDLVVVGLDRSIIWEYKLMKLEGAINPEIQLNELGLDGWMILPSIYYGFGGRMKFLMMRPVFPDEK